MVQQETALHTVDRVQVVQRLQAYLLPLADIDYDTLNELEQTQHPYLPSIGAEVEIPWSARFPDFSDRVFSEKSFAEMSKTEKALFDVLCTELDEQYLPLYQAVTDLGVPRDPLQKFWEFAHSPVHHYQTLASEIGLLMRSDLIPEGQSLPFHVTLGNLKIGSGLFYIQMLAEIAGGATAERIRAAIGDMPIYNRKWARKASNGLKERKPHELRGANYGVELRTFALDSLAQATQTLRVSQLLGAALNAYRSSRATGAAPSELSKIWKEVIFCAKRIETTGIQLSGDWSGPAKNPGPWLAYADFLDPNGIHSEERIQMVAELEELLEKIEQTVFVE